MKLVRSSTQSCISCILLALVFSLVTIPSIAQNPVDLKTVYHHEEFLINSGPDQLAGSFYKPKAKGKFPVVIFVHGSGPVKHDFYGYYDQLWNRFLTAGYACISWDRPGTGKSISGTGTFENNMSFFQRAGELRNILDYLHQRKDVDTKRIGCWGISQAGWIMPMVAAHTNQIAFIIAVSSPAESPEEQGYYQYRIGLRDEGMPESQIDSTIHATRANRARTKPNIDSAFFNFLAGKKHTWSESYKSGREHGTYFMDPQPYLEKVTCPVLAIYGSTDRVVDPVKYPHLYQKVFSRNPSQLTLRVFNDADHMIFQSLTGSDELWMNNLSNKKYPYAEGYLDLMTDWLKSLK